MGCRSGAVLFFVLLGLMVRVVLAQDPYVKDTVAVRGAMPYADLIGSPLDTIDPVSGKLSLRIPLGSIPAGRGGHGFEVALVYDSHLYDMYPYQVEGYPPPTYQKATLLYNGIGESQTGGGWNYNFRNIRVWLEEKANRDIYDPNHPYQCSEDKVVAWRLRVGLEDGSAHILHLRPASGNNEVYYRHDGFAGVTDAGVVRPGCSEYYGWAPRSGLLTYYTSDGTFLKLEKATNSAWWRLYFPDGRRVVGMGSEAKEIYDANGNRVTITNVAGSPYNYTLLTDDSGRWVKIEYNVETAGASLTRDRITAPGPNGDLVWTVDWETIYPGGNGQVQTKYYSEYNGDCGGYCEYFPDPTKPLGVGLKVVRYVQLPLTAHKTLGEIAQHLAAPGQYGGPPVHNSYRFGYSDWVDVGAGELDYMRTPSGAELFYTYRYQGVGVLGADLYVNRNGVVWRRLAYNDGDAGNDNHTCPFGVWSPTSGLSPCEAGNTDRLQWVYETDDVGSATVTQPDGGQWKYYFNGGGYYPWGQSLVYRVEEPGGRVRKRVWAENKVFCHSGCYTSTFAQNPYVARETVTEGDAGGNPARTRVTAYSYDKNGNLTAKQEYDWVNWGGYGVVETGVELKRQTSLEYYVTTPDATNIVPTNVYGYWQPHYGSIWSDPVSARRLDAVRRRRVHVGGTNYAATEYVYDDAYGRGNVTQEKRWDSVKAASLPGLGQLTSSNAQVLTRGYDTYGNLTDVYEPEVRTKITYNGTGDRVTRVEVGYGTAAQRSTAYGWNGNETVLLWKADLDNGVTTTYTYDGVGRRIGVNEHNVRKTETLYDDANRKVTVRSDLRTFGDGKVQSVTHYDGLGRVRLVQKTDGLPLEGETDGIKVRTMYGYFSGGRRVVVSTPYRATTDGALEWTCTQYDRLDRVTLVSVYKGGVAPTDCTSVVNRTGNSTRQYDGEWVTVTDAAGKARREKRDGLGRLVQVVEDPTGLNYSTGYVYDALDNLTQVSQGVQTRVFNYSSLSWLVSASNPESGTVGYTYYDSGELKRRTDARGVWVETSYDGLHRIQAKSYSDGTPAVTYEYYEAGAPSPNIGQLKSVRTSEASTEYIGYDVLGRVTATRHTVSGLAGVPTFSYEWYLSGALKSVRNPSGRQVNYTVDEAGRVNRVYALGRTYVDMTGLEDAYSADGRLAKMALGNGLYETREYRVPGQTTYYRLGQVLGGGDRVEIGYNFSGTGNNGNVLSQQISRFGGSFQQTQVYGYDGVNRLVSVSEGGYGRGYGYDRYGNRWVTQSTWPVNVEAKEPTGGNQFNGVTNRLAMAGVTYDAAGNQTGYGVYTLGYDAEGRNTTVTSTGYGSGTYVYDGEGRRVKKVWTPQVGQTVTTYYVYNALGQVGAEYSDQVPTGSGTSYLFTDMLGSVRAVTDGLGQVVECYDYEPFGRLLSTGDNGRGTCYPVAPDTQLSSQVPPKFTGKERDAETGLDYFGARYYSGAQGRFAGPDIPLIDQKPEDPQSWNLYAYARNNPLRFVDPDGYAAWEIKNEWTEEYIKKYQEFSKEFIKNYNEKVDCADLALTAIVEFAAQNNLPLDLRYYDSGSKSWASIDAASDAFQSKAEYLGKVTTDLGALNVIDNSVAIPVSKTAAGDLIMTKYDESLGHTRVVYSSTYNQQNKDYEMVWYQGNMPAVVPQRKESLFSKISDVYGNKPRRWSFEKWKK